MVVNPLPWSETARLAALTYYQILDTPPEAEFDDITSLAAQICDTPIAMMSLIDHNRQWFKSKIGVEMNETPRDISICDYAIRQPGFFTIPDIAQEPRFSHSPLVLAEPHLRFYAGAPLVGRDKMPLGMLCVLDRHPRTMEPAQERALEQLSRQIMSLLELRALRQIHAGDSDDHAAFCTLDHAFRFSYASGPAEALLGAADRDLVGQNFWSKVSRTEHAGPPGRAQPGLVEGDFDGIEAFCRATGKWICFRAQRSPFGFSLYMTDVTPARREKNRLSLLETAVARLNDVIIISEAEPLSRPGPKVVFVNDAFTRVTGYAADEIIGRSPHMLHGKNTQAEARMQIRTALERWQSVRAEIINYKKNGEEFWFELDVAPIADEAGWFTHWVAVERNITQRKRYEFLREAESPIFRAISLGVRLEEIFQQILIAADKVFAGGRTAIMTVTPDGQHMRHAASPNLPAAYIETIGELQVGPRVGSCGTAVYRRQTVISSDIASDPLWTDYKMLALSHSLRACWSLPVMNAEGFVLASLAIYWNAPRSPTDVDLELAERFSRLVSLAIEHSRKEEALRDSELRFRQLAEVIDEVFWMANYGGRTIHYVSPAYDKIWGKSSRELYANRHSWFDAVHEEDKPWVKLKRYALVDRFETIEYRIVHKDGSIRWILDRIFPVQDIDGNIVRIVGIAKDITEDKNAQERLLESEQRSSLVASITTDAIWEYDIATQKYWWGDGVYSVFGHTPTADNGHEIFYDCIDSADQPRVAESIRQAIEGYARDWSSEYHFKRFDGSTAIVLNKAIIVRDGAGIAIKMVGGLSDITAQRELDERLRQSQRLEAIGQLTGGIAHDFNNLLQVIVSNAEYLQEMLDHDKTLAAIANLITAAADQGALLIERLLTFSRRQTLQTKPADIKELMTRVEAILRRTLGDNIDIVLSCPPTAWFALVDSSQLENALLNLAINSRDAMPQGGRLSIRIENVRLDESHDAKFEEFVPGDYLMVTVADNGTGMTEATRSHAFEPFFTTKDVGEGTGLGLSMVYGFIKQSNGYLSIDSKLGAGTTVTMYLPRAIDAVTERTISNPSRTAIRGAGRILVVEDNDLVRGQVSIQLQTLGFDVVAARSASDALEVLMRDRPFDLLFTDVVMPGGMNGYQLASEASQMTPGIRILLTTGYSDQVVKNLAGLDPGVSVIPKPYRRDQLSLKLQEIFGAKPGEQPLPDDFSPPRAGQAGDPRTPPA